MGVKRLTRALTPAEIAKLSQEELDLPVTWQDLQEALGDTNPSVCEVRLSTVLELYVEEQYLPAHSL
ncbi:hypothetical protein ANCDUO_21936 [Ancylostoma duodenale]|uniref:Uncharacterized protein n=1 Tax=Ancylostoma duodenale TaxID=51022 RepID=A0A0C2FMR3_9BILA|nr:hypothetical protein ANCDUO_21936 [Ancylostoma duodenale]